MNINRVLWLATTILFTLTGLMCGWALGLFYTSQKTPESSFVDPRLHNVVVATMALGGAILMARLGASVAKAIISGLGRVHELSVVDRVLGIFGVLLGLVFGALITAQFDIPGIAENLAWTIQLIKLCLMAVSAALGMALMQGMRGEMLRAFPVLDENNSSPSGSCAPKFLDTNVIIDGRIADLCRTGFLEGPIWVPNFVLNELQYIADSSDSMRRVRGRRGLDSLNAMRALTLTVKAATPGSPAETMPAVQVLSDIPAAVMRTETVDEKLVVLAKEMGGTLVTNDFNLNRVAEMHGVKVLNINELALALKPVVLPGEEMTLTISREGKEAGQGVGYLDDGTMVVVNDGRAHVGETCKVTISQVLQTVAGKMIFAELRSPKGAGDDLFNENGNNDFPGRPGGGARRKSRS